VQLIGSAEGNQSAIRGWRFFAEWVVQRYVWRYAEERKQIARKYYKNDQFGYTSMVAFKCSGAS
jgi:hypothetical protein